MEPDLLDTSCLCFYSAKALMFCNYIYQGVCVVAFVGLSVIRITGKLVNKF